MNSLKLAILLLVCAQLDALEFRPQLEGLLPTRIEQFYQKLNRQELLAINKALTQEHNNFHAQVKQLDDIDHQLAKRFFIAFSDLDKKLSSFSKPLKFFYFWRVLHVINDLLLYPITESNLNKFASDVAIEWKLLSAEERKQFGQLFPEIAARIEDAEFQSFAAQGRKLWSVDRFVVPSR